MTDEGMAEEWWNNWVVKDWLDLYEAKGLFIQAFLAGLKAGRPQWHYPSKGELPTDDKDMLMSKTLLLITKMKGSDCLSLALGQYNFSTQEFSYQHIVGLTDVIAWKEIVPPSDKENANDNS